MIDAIYNFFAGPLYLAILHFYTTENLLKWGISSLSGGIASCVSSFCLYPIENVKTRLQVV